MKKTTCKRSWFILFCLILTATAVIACSGNKTKTHKIGIVNNAKILNDVILGFKQKLTQLGYIQGKHITYLYDGAVKEPEKLQSTANALATDVDLILTLTTTSTLIAKKAAVRTNVPVLFTTVTDPLGAGIVKSLSHPGENITGIALGAQEQRRLEWLVRIAPGIKKIYAPYNPLDPSPSLALETARQTAAKLKVELITQHVKNHQELDRAIENIPKDIDAIFLLPDSLVAAGSKKLNAAAVKLKIPVSSSTCEGVKNFGSLISFGIDLTAIGEQGARLADQILRGVPPSDIPVETAGLFLAINLKTANAIGLKIPDQILKEAQIIVR